ncbi:eukaryotic translation initiation factor 4G [Dorcoceras hygrometricum]|uniref:Eukaryotic translation initiation factor 4G n=1 Tax=Dorcoceras hygrometricum TaxID=472368 RepID=A0A2Z7DDR2_9LAMI|nr:eukaryotic translation initiation factor 4G [Dorcoceras hygrometricum]
MSQNQSRADRSESTQHKKTGRSGSYNQPRQFSGSISSKGGGGGISAPLNSSNRGVKKYNGSGPGVQSRPRSPNVSTGSSSSYTSQGLQNDAHKQQLANSLSDEPVTSSSSNVDLMDATPQQLNQVVPRPSSSDISVAAPSFNPSTASSEPKAPTTPVKTPGDASRSFPLQFGSISPGFMNGVQIPARTSSAPPNLDEQKQDQVRHQSLRTAAPAKALSSIPKQLSTKKEAGNFDQSNAGESQPVSMSRRDTQVSTAPPLAQTQKPSVLSVPGMPMQLQYHQPQVSVQFGGPNPQIQSQPMSGNAMQLPMPMPLPLPLGNPPVQQPLFVSGLPPHPMQSQGMMHQGQALNFPSQMGPQLGNMGMNMVPQFPPQQAVKYSSSRKTVKITHPETHEELRLDGSPGQRSHANVQPQSQHIPSFPPNHPMNFYPNPYNTTSFYFPAASSLPPNSTQASPTSQPSKFYNQVIALCETIFAILPHYCCKIHALNVYIANLVTVKPAIEPHGEKEVLQPKSSILVGKAQSLKPSKLQVDDSARPRKEIGPSASNSSESKPGAGTSLTSELPSGSVDVEVNVPTTVTFAAADGFASKSTTLAEEASNGVVCDPVQNEHKKSDIGHRDQVSWQSTSHSNYPPQLSETEAVEAKSTTFKTDIVSEPVKELFSTTIGAPSEASNLSSEGATESKTIDTPSLGTSHIKSRQLKPDTVGGKEHSKAILLITEQNSLDTLVKPLSLESPELERSLQEVASTADGLLERPKQKTEEPSGCCYDTKVDDHVLESTHPAYCEGVENSASVNSFSAHDLNIKISDLPSRMPENISTRPAIVDQESSPALITSLEGAFVYENEDNDPNSCGIISPPAIINEKILPDTNVPRSTVPRTKKKKDFYKKAEAAGTSSDIYMAYKGPEEKKETAMLAEDLENISSSSIKQASVDVPDQNSFFSEKPTLSRVEPDDWENAAEVPTPQLETSNNEIQNYDGDGDGLMIKRYSRDFLFKFAEQCTDLPEGFELASDIADALMASNVHFSREPHPSPGRNIDRSTGGSRLDRRGSDLGDEDKWNKIPGPIVSGRGDTRVDVGYVGNVAGFRVSQGGNYGVLRNPRGQTSVHYSGVLSGPIQPLGPQGGLQRNNSDSDRWQRGTSYQKGLIPSPQTPLQVMHKAEKKYEIGKVTDEEEAKQRQLKSILNKLTPQNFEKLFEQVKQVNIDNFVTLSGVISQIFDKALMEPTFCEMYANFCSHLAADLPNLKVDNETITFKTLLLNKCQEEFERGEREEEEANKVEEEGENKHTAEEREQKRLQARRRMLGNIRLIGELYKKKMLTARIMHECINKLLGQQQTPDEENIEALCKLMSTIGVMMDNPKAKEHMDVYFDIMANLSNNMKLSSRVRFMLKDVIDLRKNRWQQRRKVEGPKKIEEVHRDAAQERQAQASRLGRAPSMGSSVRRGPQVDFAPRTPNMLPSPNSQMSGFRAVPPQIRGYGSQDVRTEERHSIESRTMSVPLSQRPLGDEPITLGPQGGLARGMAFRGQPSTPNIPLPETQNPGDARRMGPGLNGYNSVPDRYGQREDFTPRYIPDMFAAPPNYDQSLPPEQKVTYGNRDTRSSDHGFDRPLPTSPPTRSVPRISIQDVSSEIVWPEERLRDKSVAAIKEFYSARDENEVALCIKDLNAPSFYPSMISIWVIDSFEKNDVERDLLTKLLISLVKRQDGTINEYQLIKGFESVFSVLEDEVTDAPRAAEFLSGILAQVILEDIVALSTIEHLIYEGGEEQGRLVEIGLADEVLGGILEIIKSEKGDSVLNEIRSSSNLQLVNFIPPGSKKSWRLDKFI